MSFLQMHVSVVSSDYIHISGVPLLLCLQRSRTPAP